MVFCIPPYSCMPSNLQNRLKADWFLWGQVGAEAVARCERGRLTLRPGAELAAGRVSEGLLGLAIDKARVRSHA